MNDERIAALYATEYRRLVGLIYTLCGDRAEAEDVVAEAFVRALAQGNRLEAVFDLEAWIRTVALNLARARWRRRQTGNRLLRRVASADRQETSLLGQGDRSEDQIDLLNALAKLPRGQREVLVLHYVGDLPLADIAGSLRIPVGTVKARLSRGRKALAQSLGDPALPEGPHSV